MLNTIYRERGGERAGQDTGEEGRGEKERNTERRNTYIIYYRIP